MPDKQPYFEVPASIHNCLTKAISKIQKPKSFNISQFANRHSSCQIVIRSLRPGGLVKFSLVEMTGCCMYLISTDTYIDGCYRGKGLSYALQEAKENLARCWGYTKLFCTVTMDNKAELKVLAKSGWKQIDEEVNSRTSNTVGMFVKTVKLV